MKTIIFFAFSILLIAETAYASQMIVQLRSGNALTINYTGTIENITLEGTSDAITGMTMQKEQQQNVLQSPTHETEPSTSKTNKSATNFKWARPVDDENLKMVREK